MEAEPGAHFFTVIAGAKLASVAGAGGALLTRIKKEPSEKEYVCVICSAFMIGDEDYQAHMEQHNAQSQFNFPCSDCDGSFASRYDLEIHTLQTHSQLMKFEYAHIKEEVQINEAPPLTEARLDLLASDAKCPRCSEYFATKILLRDHQIAEHPEYYTGYLCRHNKCNQKFYKYDEYIHHLAEHKLKHVCPYCDRFFRLRQTLQQHIRIHTGEKPFECPQCNRAFAVKDYLTKHLRIHTGEKPYECYQGCGSSFTQQTTRNKHMKDHCPLRNEWAKFQENPKIKIKITKRRRKRTKLEKS